MDNKWHFILVGMAAVEGYLFLVNGESVHLFCAAGIFIGSSVMRYVDNEVRG